MFKRRFRMRRELFLGIVEALANHSEYFRRRVNSAGTMGISTIQKCTVAIRQLAYGTSADCNDEYIRIGERTALDCLMNFCRCLIEVFRSVYQRRSNANDVQRLLQHHEEIHGFPGMLGSIDCMHWQWRNCPVAWKGQYTRGDHGVPTIMLEVVASHDFWIWHTFFGVAGSTNDLNVLNQSPVFNDVLRGKSPEVYFTVNGRTYTKGYYLADGIYLEWATIVKSFVHPQDLKRRKFKQMQESTRKDVERAFGVLQSSWAIVRGPSRSWNPNTLKDIMKACVILHNMIVEDESNAISFWDNDEIDHPPEVSQGSIQGFQLCLQGTGVLRDRNVHRQLRLDLVEHIWERFGQENS